MEAEQARLRQQYEARLSELEAERQGAEADLAQVVTHGAVFRSAGSGPAASSEAFSCARPLTPGSCVAGDACLQHHRQGLELVSAAQVPRYKALLLKQRDIMIALTERLQVSETSVQAQRMMLSLPPGLLLCTSRCFQGGVSPAWQYS